MSNHGGRGEARQTPSDNTEASLQRAQVSRHRRQREAVSPGKVALAPDTDQARLEMAASEHRRAHATSSSGAGGRRAWGWALAPPALAAALLVAALLIWWPIDTSATGSTVDRVDWLYNAAPLPAPPTATPTPTLAPAQIAAQFAPQLRDALSGQNWDRALEIVSIMSSVDASGTAVREWAFATSMQYGQALVENGHADQALGQFDRAVALAPDDAEARLWQGTTRAYLTGRDASEAGRWQAAVDSFALADEWLPDYGDLSTRLVEAHLGLAQAKMTKGDWTAAIETLLPAQERRPDDKDVADLLATAYRQRGIVWHDTGMRGGTRINIGKLRQARADLDAALALRPDDAEARAVREQVIDYLFPSKRIEVDISKQRVYAWKGDTLVYEFLVSTGLRGQDTATGHFQVLDRMPMAHSRIWKLDMPYWLGIYYVQGIENGFHALPIRPDGSKMWAGLLGQRASYGCIVLGTKAGRTLYKWAEVGTRVDIHN